MFVSSKKEINYHYQAEQKNVMHTYDVPIIETALTFDSLPSICLQNEDVGLMLAAWPPCSYCRCRSPTGVVRREGAGSRQSVSRAGG